MPAVIWIATATAAMALLALSGSITLALPGPAFSRAVLPLVALAAGSLLGGALFHLLPGAVTLLGNHLGLYGWVAGRVFTFFLLGQYLHWHHCHRGPATHRPLGYLILIADGFHNLIDGLAIGAALLASTELGLVTWLVLAAHEIPQELGDFGILIHAGWSRRAALVQPRIRRHRHRGRAHRLGPRRARRHPVLLPFAAGNFIYIALADLVPELTTTPAPHQKAILTSGFAAGLLLLALNATLAH